MQSLYIYKDNNVLILEEKWTIKLKMKMFCAIFSLKTSRTIIIYSFCCAISSSTPYLCLQHEEANKEYILMITSEFLIPVLIFVFQNFLFLLLIPLMLENWRVQRKSRLFDEENYKSIRENGKLLVNSKQIEYNSVN